MSPRNTTTGSVLEQMILPALRRGGYEVNLQVNVGKRLGGGRHIVDAVAAKQGLRWLISMKWQQVSGTAEQKVPFEVICLAEAVQSELFEAAYLVLGGPGWSLRDFYTGDGLRQHLSHAQKIRIVSLEDFVASANQGSL
ncbi:MAG TPA: PD-(D/E)XK nuclease superfamily protein [Candidatus Polarisedimenticolia bacterium]|jgi:hypothetical protein|nr:PD-(D/E)XK nuclease superfamily protein [Candidatus Polarisedimenticolia bacterium]